LKLNLKKKENLGDKNMTDENQSNNSNNEDNTISNDEINSSSTSKLSRQHSIDYEIEKILNYDIGII
jgi:hypothetical protein